MNVDLIKQFIFSEGAIETILQDNGMAFRLTVMSKEWQKENDPEAYLQSKQEEIQAQIDELTVQQEDVILEKEQVSNNLVQKIDVKI